MKHFTPEMIAAVVLMAFTALWAIPGLMVGGGSYATPVTDQMVPEERATSVVVPATAVTRPLAPEHAGELVGDPFSKPQASGSAVENVRLPALPLPRLRLPDLPILPMGSDDREGLR